MQPKHSNNLDISFTVNGSMMESMQLVDLKYEPEEREIKNGENLTLYNREFTLTLENVEINKEFIGKLFTSDKIFTVIGTGYKFPRGSKFPKKKRIRKKWMKKYGHEFKLDSCTIL